MSYISAHANSPGRSVSVEHLDLVPSKIIGIGGNDRGRGREMGKHLPEAPLMFLGPRSSASERVASEPVVIGIGGNLGTEAAIVERFDRARTAIGALGSVRSAPLYRTAPIGPAQPAFLNTAVRVALADGQPAELIATLLEIERMLGRARLREARWGPRTIDLDVLVWGDRIVRTDDLVVPHPRLAERKFALAPLVALLGEGFAVPGLATAGELMRRVAAQDCDEIAASW